jgi:hypothetical protein
MLFLLVAQTREGRRRYMNGGGILWDSDEDEDEAEDAKRMKKKTNTMVSVHSPRGDADRTTPPETRQTMSTTQFLSLLQSLHPGHSLYSVPPSPNIFHLAEEEVMSLLSPPATSFLAVPHPRPQSRSRNTFSLHPKQKHTLHRILRYHSPISFRVHAWTIPFCLP